MTTAIRDLKEKKAVQENQPPISLQRTIEPPFNKIILARLLRKIPENNETSGDPCPLIKYVYGFRTHITIYYYSNYKLLQF